MFLSLSILEVDLEVAVSMLREGCGGGSGVGGEGRIAGVVSEVDHSELHVASRCQGPAFLLRAAEGDALKFDGLCGEIIGACKSVELLGAEHDDLVIYLVPCLARCASSSRFVMFGYLVSRGTLRRVTGRVLALGLDLDDTLVHSYPAGCAADRGGTERQDLATPYPLDFWTAQGAWVMWARSRLDYLLRHLLVEHADVFDVYVVSAGQGEYVASVCEALRRHFAPGVDARRVFHSRGHGCSKKKCLFEMIGEAPTAGESPLMAAAVDDIPQGWAQRGFVLPVESWSPHRAPSRPQDEPRDEGGADVLLRLVQRIDAEYIRQRVLLETELSRWSTVFRRMCAIDGANLSSIATYDVVGAPVGAMPVGDYMRCYYDQAFEGARPRLPPSQMQMQMQMQQEDALARAQEETTALASALFDENLALRRRIRGMSRPRRLRSDGLPGDSVYLSLIQIVAVLVRFGRIRVGKSWPELSLVTSSSADASFAYPVGAVVEELRRKIGFGDDFCDLFVRGLELGMETTSGTIFEGSTRVVDQCVACGRHVVDETLDPTFRMLEGHQGSACTACVACTACTACSAAGSSEGVSVRIHLPPNHASALLAVRTNGAGSFPDELSLISSGSSDDAPRLYDLVATVVVLREKRYAANVRTREGVWYRCSDAEVREVDPESVHRQPQDATTCALFYEHRESDDHPGRGGLAKRSKRSSDLQRIENNS